VQDTIPKPTQYVRNIDFIGARSTVEAKPRYPRINTLLRNATYPIAEFLLSPKEKPQNSK
jgi:hypothetical protein